MVVIIEVIGCYTKTSDVFVEFIMACNIHARRKENKFLNDFTKLRFIFGLASVWHGVCIYDADIEKQTPGSMKRESAGNRE